MLSRTLLKVPWLRRPIALLPWLAVVACARTVRSTDATMAGDGEASDTGAVLDVGDPDVAPRPDGHGLDAVAEDAISSDQGAPEVLVCPETVEPVPVPEPMCDGF